MLSSIEYVRYLLLKTALFALNDGSFRLFFFSFLLFLGFRFHFFFFGEKEGNKENGKYLVIFVQKIIFIFVNF